MVFLFSSFLFLALGHGAQSVPQEQNMQSKLFCPKLLEKRGARTRVSLGGMMCMSHDRNIATTNKVESKFSCRPLCFLDCRRHIGVFLWVEKE